MHKQAISRMPSSIRTIARAKAAVKPPVAPRQAVANTKLINHNPNLGDAVALGFKTIAKAAKRLVGR